MNKVYTSYVQIIKDAITSTSSSLELSLEEQQQLTQIAKRHCSGPFLLPYITDASCLTILKQQTKSLILNYYQIERFTQKVVSLLEEHDIPYVLLKGISLASYYPTFEYRKLGDVDIYINDKASVSLAKKVLQENGFVDTGELSDHHITYHYTFPNMNRTYMLELHFRVVGLYQYNMANKVVDKIYASSSLAKTKQTIGNRSYFVLAPTEYTFYMLHHMLKHYLYSGFGIRLLCDFIFYVNANYKQIDFKKIHIWCRTSRISHLYEIIIQTCHTYLGLSEQIEPSISYDLKKCESFLLRILEEKDMGDGDAATLVGSGSYKKVNVFTYVKEGHLQMRVRFPKLSKCPLLWPFLWVITLVVFLKNTYCLRKTTLKGTLQAFSDSNEKSRLIRIFDNSDS